MSFEWKVATRYFITGGMQSVLTVLGVAVGVTVFVFIASLIGGLQKGLIQRTIGSLSQVTIEPQPNDPKTLADLMTEPPGSLSLTRVEKMGQREARIDNWKPLVALLDREPGVTAVSPVVSGAGFAIRGSQTRPITFRGCDAERNSRIIDLQNRMVAGRYDLSGQNCVIGIELAKDLGIGLRGKIRTQSSKNRELTFTVAGIFDAGNADVNRRSFYISLTNAQRLLDLVGYITAIETKVADVFEANTIADRIAAKTGLDVKSWMRQNVELLGALQAQSGSRDMIKAFTMVSVAFGIASVLIVSVVQKSREIGILKSMGARTRSILLIFLFQGLFVGALGSLLGCALGAGLVWLILQIPGTNPAQAGRLFPAELEWSYLVQAFVTSVVIGILAGVAPARRAAKLDPVEVIRYG
jgi:lipoprotein-releasing system permease protein